MGGRTEVVLRVARDPSLRRLQLSFAGFAFAEHATWLAVLVFAFGRGGVSEAGIVAVVQLVPAILLAPFAAYAGDRFRPNRALAMGYAAQAGAMIATAAAMWADRPIIAYVAATAAATSITFTRPVMGAIMPLISATPADLVAANVVMSLVEYAGMFVGPLVGAVVLANGSAAAVFAISAGATALCAAMTIGMDLREDAAGAGRDMDFGDVFSEIFGGLRALRQHVILRVLVGLMVIGGLTRGVNDVLIVYFAEARLDGGGGNAGLLGGAMGVGAMVGSLAAAGMIGRSRVVPYFLLGAALLGGPFFALTPTHSLVPALALFLFFGMGESVLRVTADVAVQRRSPSGVTARIFGVAEGIQMGAMAAGSLAVSLLARKVTLSTTMVVLGATVLLAMLGGIAYLRRLGGDGPPPPVDVVARLIADPVLTHLPVPALERLAFGAERVPAESGDVVVVEGDVGDKYYLIVDGAVSITIGGELIREMGPGQSFGEIALLRDTPRTATVTCITDVELLAIGRDEFLEAVTGHPRSLATADDVARTFLRD